MDLSLSHRLALHLELLQVLGEFDADVHHHVLSNQLPLSCVVVHLIQDVQEGLVVGEPMGGGGGGTEEMRSVMDFGVERKLHTLLLK